MCVCIGCMDILIQRKHLFFSSCTVSLSLFKKLPQYSVFTLPVDGLHLVNFLNLPSANHRRILKLEYLVEASQILPP